MRDEAAPVQLGLHVRVRHCLRRPHNWLQLVRFTCVGASGYAVNLAVFAACVHLLGIDYRLSAGIAFLVAVTNNFLLHRRWTFRARHGHAGSPPTQDRPPPGHVRSARQVLSIANTVPKVRAILPHHRGWTETAYLKGPARWQVSWFDPEHKGKPRKEIAQVIVDDRTGGVVEAWTGFQVAWTMARGYPGAFGRKADALYVWIPLCVLFLVPFVDPRRPLRLLHLDLLVLLGFSVSLAFFNHGQIGVSVPLAYPFLGYLLVRLLAAARPRARPPDPVRLLVPAGWLAVALVFLVGFRVGLNVVNSNVIDVGYAGVIGADRLTHGQSLYGHFPSDNEHGDTYGPANYYAYVPFEQALPWNGHWDD